MTQAENRIWHAHPVWFPDANPIVGYSRLNAGTRLMFRSGASFTGPGLEPGTGKFRDASVVYRSATEIDPDQLVSWH